MHNAVKLAVRAMLACAAFALSTPDGWAQAVQADGPPIGLSCAFNASPLTAAPTGSAVRVQCDAQGNLIISNPGGGGAGSVTQGTSPWVDNITQWASVALGAPTAYGTAPIGIVPGVNAFVTNPVVLGASSATIGSISNTSFAVSNGGTFAVQNNAPTPAGTNIIGKVGIDGTTDGTTNGVVLRQNGGVVAVTNPLISQLYRSGSPVSETNPLSAAEVGSSIAAAGIAPALAQTGTALVAKASQGNLYSAYALSTATNTVQEYLAVINAASAPASGAAITPVDFTPIGTGATTVAATGSINYGAGPPNAYSTGITVLITTSLTVYTPGSNALIAVRVR